MCAKLYPPKHSTLFLVARHLSVYCNSFAVQVLEEKLANSVMSVKWQLATIFGGNPDWSGVLSLEFVALYKHGLLGYDVGDWWEHEKQAKVRRLGFLKRRLMCNAFDFAHASLRRA